MVCLIFTDKAGIRGIHIWIIGSSSLYYS